MPNPPTRRPPGPGEGVNALVILGVIFVVLNQLVLHWVTSGRCSREARPRERRRPTSRHWSPRWTGSTPGSCRTASAAATARRRRCRAAAPTAGTRAPSARVSGSSDKGFDCSSAVSWVLQDAGYDHRTMDTSEFTRWGEPGRGEHATLWVVPDRGAVEGHVLLQIDDRHWGTDASNPRHGPGWHPPRSTDGYAPRHLPGW